jgi:HEAT repeat protein
MIDEFSSFPLADKHDHEILMHRDVHFSGSFPLMIEYYENEGKGTYPEFEITRIKHLYQVQEKSGQDLSEVFLEPEEKEEIQRARAKYAELKKLYQNGSKNISELIADLILTESIDADEEINKVCEKGSDTLPYLIALIETEDFYNPLFPGYGHAPAYAATCLGKIKDTKAIAPLYEALGRADFFTEEAVLDALQCFGKDAIAFLTKVLTKEPFTKDNENAAIALLSLKIDEEISKIFLSILSNPSSHKRESFTTYLILGCEALSSDDDKKKFSSITSSLASREAKEEAALIERHWKK